MLYIYLILMNILGVIGSIWLIRKTSSDLDSLYRIGGYLCFIWNAALLIDNGYTLLKYI